MKSTPQPSKAMPARVKARPALVRMLSGIIMLAILTGCSRCRNSPKGGGDKTKSAAAHHILKIEMATSYCEGSCPVFGLTIREDHTADYNAIAYNRKDGRFKSVLSNRDYDKLIRLLEQTGFEQLQERYAVAATDMSSFRMTIVYDDGKVKNIDDYGMEGTKALEDFYAFIFRLTETQDWR